MKSNSVRMAARHSDIHTTNGYMRNEAEATARTLQTRVEHRNGGAA